MTLLWLGRRSGISLPQYGQQLLERGRISEMLVKKRSVPCVPQECSRQGRRGSAEAGRLGVQCAVDAVHGASVAFAESHHLCTSQSSQLISHICARQSPTHQSVQSVSHLRTSQSSQSVKSVSHMCIDSWLFTGAQ